MTQPEPTLIFPDQPKLTKADVVRLLPMITTGREAMFAWLRTAPSKADAQLALLLEIRRAKTASKFLAVKEIKRFTVAQLLRYVRDCEMQEREVAIFAELQNI